MSALLRLADAVDRLERHYGTPETASLRDPFELVLFENAAHSVSPAVRNLVFERLRAIVGTTPEALVNEPIETIIVAIESGGPEPRERAEKLRACGELALRIGVAKLREAVTENPLLARKLLKRFPGIGDPGADKILLYCAGARTIAPDSNALRVLVRLGFGEEHKDFGRTYRQTNDAIEEELVDDVGWRIKARGLFLRHGQEVCKRNSPACSRCPLVTSCRFAVLPSPDRKS